MIDLIQSEFRKIVLNCINKYAKDNTLSPDNVQLMLGLNEKGNTYQIMVDYAKKAEYTIMQVLDVRIDFLGYSKLVPPFIEKSLKRFEYNLEGIAEVICVRDLNEKGIELQLVIVDTLNRSFGGGNENSSDDMGAWITGVGNLQRMFNVALMVLHHSGKDVAKGLRGHSSLLGAVDTELEILRFDGQPKGILTLTKQKDGEDGGRFAFKVVTVSTKSTDLGLSDESSSLAIERDESYV
jgi:hypothetical protein